MKTKTDEMKIWARGLSFAAAMASAAATAGVLNLDTVDACDYVSDGLVLNYDGIRNAGLDSVHITNATTWVNLGSGGAEYDLERIYYSVGNFCWKENCFTNDAKAHFHSKSVFTFPTTRTMQACFISTRTDHSYIFSPCNQDMWQCGSLQLPPADNGNYYLNFNAHWYKYQDDSSGGSVVWSAAARPRTACANLTTNYVSAFLTPGYAALTLGTNRPTSGNRSTGYVSLEGGQRSVEEFSTKFNLMANNVDDNRESGMQKFKGQLYSFRFYNRVLSDGELAHNRIVDELRFFGNAPATTNAILQSWPAALSGNEANGAYVFTAGTAEHTFSAPATISALGKPYICLGHVIETWDGSAWGAPATNAEMSVTVTAGTLVRITWLWQTTKEVDGGVGVYSVDGFDADDYVAGGLYLHYDGKRNAGLSVPHSNSTAKWVNLGSGGSELDMDWKTKATAQGGWADDGFAFTNSSDSAGGWFQTPSNNITYAKSYVEQVLVDAKVSDQNADKTCNYVTFPENPAGAYPVDGWYYSALAIRKDPSSSYYLYFVADRAFSKTGSLRPKFDYGNGTENEYSYATAIIDGEACSATLTDGMGKTNTETCAGGAGAEHVFSRFRLGGGQFQKQNLTGKVKNFRHYNRLLSDGELEWNRVVDEARFFGRLAVTNVEVWTESAPHGAASFFGAFAVDPSGGTATAPAATVTDSIGNVWRYRGGSKSVWDGSDWGDPVEFAGAGVEVRGDEKAKIVWRLVPASFAFSADDYDVGDYVQRGLMLHYDGIRNAGAAAEHDADATTWKNIAPDFVGQYDLVFTNVYASVDDVANTNKWGDAPEVTGINWESDGHVFDGVGFFRWNGDGDEDSPTYCVFTNRNRLTTMQCLSTVKPGDFKATDGIQYLSCIGSWNRATLAVRRWATRFEVKSANSCHLVADASSQAREYKASDYETSHETRVECRPYFPLADSSTEAGYMTAMMYRDNERKRLCASCFAGTTYPCEPTELHVSETNQAYMYYVPTLSLGGWGNRDFQNAVGKIRSFRYYEGVLTEAELAQNRAVDEARFFGKVTTNAVVRSSLPFIPGNEDGEYPLCGEYVFSAPATATHDGNSYACAGYVLERWNDRTGGYGAPEIVRGTNLAAVALGDNVRVTWLWEETAMANVAPETGIGGYVTDGLVLHFDGIRNAGADAAHDPEAKVWRNIAPDYEDRYDLKLKRLHGSTLYNGWSGDGYFFGDYRTLWYYNNPGDELELPTQMTIQVVIDAASASQSSEYGIWYTNDNYQATLEDPDNRRHCNIIDGRIDDQPFSAMGYVFFMPGKDSASKDNWKKGSISVNRGEDPHRFKFATDNRNGCNYLTRAFFNADGDDYTIKNGIAQGVPFRYATAIFDGATSMMFPGTSYPTDPSSVLTNYVGTYHTGTSAAKDSVSRFVLGGKSENPDEENMATPQGLFGTIKNFRFYNRKLTEAEIAQNRAVDEARFFGALPSTNAVVASVPGGVGGVEPCGAYSLTGPHTFSAPSVKVDSKGRVWTYSGRYLLQSHDGSAWSAATTNDGFSVSVGASELKRITWLYSHDEGNGVRGAGAGVGDYAQDGLVLQYDGVRNVGADMAHRTDSVIWRNLASSSYTMQKMHYGTLDRGLYAYARADEGGQWTDDSFRFDGKTYFVARECRTSDMQNRQSTVELSGDFTETQTGGTSGTIGYVFLPGGVLNGGGVQMSGGKARLKTLTLLGGSATADAKYEPQVNVDVSGGYFTGVIDGDFAYNFNGTTLDDSGRNTDGVQDWSNFTGADQYKHFCLGGYHSGNRIGGRAAWCFTGGIKSFRFYSRVLSEPELAWNRELDRRRYEPLAATNVVVAGECPNGMTEIPGAYAVDGSWTFTAKRTYREADGRYMRINGYTLREWDEASGEWGAAEYDHVGEDVADYTYTEGRSPKKVLLTWQWIEYIPHGMFLNYN